MQSCYLNGENHRFFRSVHSKTMERIAPHTLYAVLGTEGKGPEEVVLISDGKERQVRIPAILVNFIDYSLN